MVAPDKIYAEVNEKGFVCGYTEPTKRDDIEYIRKDLIKTELEKQIARHNWLADKAAEKNMHFTMEANLAVAHAYEYLLSYINSL